MLYEVELLTRRKIFYKNVPVSNLKCSTILCKSILKLEDSEPLFSCHVYLKINGIRRIERKPVISLNGNISDRKISGNIKF